MKKSLIIIIMLLISFSMVHAQVDESKYVEFLKNTFDKNDEDDFEFLIKQFDQFLSTFPLSKQNDHVYFMLGEVYSKDRSYFNALDNYLKVVFLFPNSPKSTQAKSNITKIVKDHEQSAFQDIQTEFLSKINDTKSSNDIQSSYFEYLSFLKSNKLDDLNEILINEVNYYLINFGEKASNADQAILWQGQLYEDENDWTEAALSYNKFKSLFPNSDLIPKVIYKLALIEYQELSQPLASKESFVNLISNYAESEYAGDAQFYLGELYEKELKNYKEAIENYKLLVETYPKNKFAIEALKRVAELMIDEEKYEEAIESYYQIVELYPQDKYSPEALLEIKDLYLRRLSNYVKAIETLKFFAQQYKNHEDAAEHLYDAAEIYYDDLDNKQAAIDTYHQVINEFAESKYAEWAKDQIESLTEE